MEGLGEVIGEGGPPTRRDSRELMSATSGQSGAKNTILAQTPMLALPL